MNHTNEKIAAGYVFCACEECRQLILPTTSKMCASCEREGCVPEEDAPSARQLTAEELEPTEGDIAAAKLLIDEGWHSTSSKYRQVSRFIVQPIPTIEELVSPEVLATYHGQRLAREWRRTRHSSDLRTSDAGVEHRTLTVRVFRAFKKLGGPMA